MLRVGIVASALGVAVVTLVVGLTHAAVPPDDASAMGEMRSLEHALNAHDSASVLALFADGATVQDSRQPQSREQIRGWIEELIRQQVRVSLVGQPSVTHMSEPSDTIDVAWRATLDLQVYRARGFEFVPATLRAAVVHRAIIRMSLHPDPNSSSVLDWQTIT